MKKALLLILALVFAPPLVFSADQWTIAAVTGSTDPSDLGTILDEQFGAADRLLRNYKEGCMVVPDTAAQVTLLPCEVMICNSAGTDCEMRQTTSSTTVSWADIDTGTEATGTQYYVYVTADTDVSGFVEKISESSTNPDGATQYRKVGYFYNDGSGDIVSVGSMAGGTTTNKVQVVGSSDITTTSTSYTDMTDMTVYFVSSGRPVEVVFTAPLDDTSNDVNLALDIDGTDVVTSRAQQQSGSATFPSVVRYIDYDLASGTHTIKVQWKAEGAGTITQNGSSYGERILTVEEL